MRRRKAGVLCRRASRTGGRHQRAGGRDEVTQSPAAQGGLHCDQAVCVVDSQVHCSRICAAPTSRGAWCARDTGPGVSRSRRVVRNREVGRVRRAVSRLRRPLGRVRETLRHCVTTSSCYTTNRAYGCAEHRKAATWRQAFLRGVEQCPVRQGPAPGIAPPAAIARRVCTPICSSSRGAAHCPAGGDRRPARGGIAPRDRDAESAEGVARLADGRDRSLSWWRSIRFPEGGVHAAARDSRRTACEAFAAGSKRGSEKGTDMLRVAWRASARGRGRTVGRRSPLQPDAYEQATSLRYPVRS